MKRIVWCEGSGQMNQISMVIPCFEEDAAVVMDTVKRLITTLDAVPEWDYEIIVVDDGSRHHAYEVPENMHNVSIVRHRVNRGYGASLSSGVSAAKYDCVGIVDADGTYPVESFPRLLEQIGEYDQAIGARAWSGVPMARRLPKWLLNRLAEWLTGADVPDLNSGMRVFRKEMVLKYRRMFPQRFSFTSTLTMLGLTDSYETCFVSVPYLKRIGSSKINPLRDTARFFNLVLRLSLSFRPLRFFMPLTGMLLLAAVLRGVRDVIEHNQFGGLTLVLFFMAFQVFFFGLVAEIVNKK